MTGSKHGNRLSPMNTNTDVRRMWFIEAFVRKLVETRD